MSSTLRNVKGSERHSSQKAETQKSAAITVRKMFFILIIFGSLINAVAETVLGDEGREIDDFQFPHGFRAEIRISDDLAFDYAFA